MVSAQTVFEEKVELVQFPWLKAGHDKLAGKRCIKLQREHLFVFSVVLVHCNQLALIRRTLHEMLLVHVHQQQGLVLNADVLVMQVKCGRVVLRGHELDIQFLRHWEAGAGSGSGIERVCKSV